jgi:acyl-CoA synthetase (AMP-forming)/AMP-acid ligase II
MLLDQRPRDARAPELRFVRSCSAALPIDLYERIESALGVPVLQAYGMTEASHQIASNPLPPARREAKSVGIPTGTEVTILDADGSPLPLGTPGEIAIRGPGLTPGYLNSEQANAEAFVGGWFRTGDQGVLAADGRIMIEGRIKELIIRGGENISPYEIEEVLRRHALVSEAACFGVPSDKYGEVVGAAVVVTTPTDERDLITYCREKLAPFKVPTVLRVVDSLPKTATGKLQRQRIAAEISREVA